MLFIGVLLVYGVLAFRDAIIRSWTEAFSEWPCVKASCGANNPF